MPEMILRSPFTQDFTALNYPGDKKSFRWCFLPGMLFLDSASWWKESKRTRGHEGVDFCRFYAGQKCKAGLVGTDLVPALFDGVVVKVEDDFLASTVWMRHEAIQRGNMVLFSALAHVEPLDGVKEGKVCGQGEVVASIGRRRDFLPMSMHLHVSVFWAPHFFKTARLGWPQLPTLKEIALFDPLQLISLSP